MTTSRFRTAAWWLPKTSLLALDCVLRVACQRVVRVCLVRRGALFSQCVFVDREEVHALYGGSLPRMVLTAWLPPASLSRLCFTFESTSYGLIQGSGLPTENLYLKVLLIAVSELLGSGPPSSFTKMDNRKGPHTQNKAPLPFSIHFSLFLINLFPSYYSINR